MRALSAIVLAVAWSGASAQILDVKPTPIQHATFAASASAPHAAAGGEISLWLDVTPKRAIHVYGPGAKGYLPIALTLLPSAAFKAGRPVYPTPQVVFFPALNERTPVYSQTFRIAQPVSVSRSVKSGEVLTATGIVDYQACDDALCYPPSKALVSWTIRVR
jgi:DsbC/DsbD-like thiol-disulfide interchange protein